MVTRFTTTSFTSKTIAEPGRPPWLPRIKRSHPHPLTPTILCWSIATSAPGNCIPPYWTVDYSPMDRILAKIRAALPTDLPRLLELSGQWADERITRNYGADTADDLNRRLGECSLVAEVGGQVVGFVLGQIKSTKGDELVEGVLDDRPDYLEVQNLYVTSEHRGRGISTKLMEQVIFRSAEIDATNSLVYSANRDYISTARFYEKLGYQMWHIHMTRKGQTRSCREHPIPKETPDE